jgi:hypothetical protein
MSESLQQGSGAAPASAGDAPAPALRKAGIRRGVSLKEPALIALETLRAHKLRSFLTLVTANIGDMDVEEPALGRYVSDADNEHRANVALIGDDIAKRFFAGVQPLGRSIYIDGESYEVIGVAKPMGSAFGQSQDNFAYIAKCMGPTRAAPSTCRPGVPS